jgi:NitT/TauT family transport system substrate-binding protein
MPKRLVAAQLAASILVTALGLAPAKADPPDDITIIVTESETPLVPNSALELADSLGYFRREGVRVHFMRVAGTPLAIAALAAGEGDMANVSLEALLKLAARGDTGFRAVSSPNKSLSYVIIARKPISSVAQLRGKLFGIGQIGTLDNTLSWHVLRASGLDPQALKVVSVGQPQSRLAALVAGKIDATTASFGSWTALPHKSELQVIVPKDVYFRAAPVVAKVNIASSRTLANKRAAAVKVTAAVIKLARWFAADSQRWATAMAGARPDVKVDDLQRLAAAYANDWCIDGCFDADELLKSAQILYGSDQFKDLQRTPISEWADFSIVADVLRAIGKYRPANRPPISPPK